MKIKVLLILLAIPGFIGTVVFFPFNYNNRYTCLYHRICSLDGNVSTNSQVCLNRNEPVSDNTEINSKIEFNELLQHYIGHFAFPWWTSISVFIFSLLMLKKINIKKLKGGL